MKRAGTSPVRSAWIALVAGSLLATSFTSVLEPPVHWRGTEPMFAGTRRPAAAWWDDLARLLPVGEWAQRSELLALLGVLVCAALASRLGYGLFRGPGRFWAAVACGPTAAMAILRWLHTAAPGNEYPALPWTVLGAMGIGVTVRTLVVAGRTTPTMAIRSLAAALAAVVLDPWPGLLLFAFLLVVLAVGSHTHRGAVPTWPRGIAGLSLCAVFVAMAGAAVWTLDIPREAWSVPSQVGIGASAFHALANIIPPILLYPGLLLAVLLIIPLRWRGGTALAAWIAISLLVETDGRPVIPLSLTLLLLAVLVCGWIWLAGSLVRARAPARWLARAAASVVLLGIPWSAEEPAVGPQPLAPHRPEAALVRLYAQGLILPGDVLLAAQDRIRRALVGLQETEGFRPDVVIADPNAFGEMALTMQATAWSSSGRRILSDSFTLGGRWPATWAMDSGPLFWFVGSTSEADRPDFVDIMHLAPEQPARLTLEERLEWERFHVERARFRRQLERPEQSLFALPVPDEQRRVVLARLTSTQSLRPPAGPVSELYPIAADTKWGEGALVFAEVGDLLYAYGDAELGAEMLREAAATGFAPAWGALLRWQLRAGQKTDAADGFGLVASDPALRDQAVEVLQWLTMRDRIRDARALRGMLLPTTDAAPEEIAARLALLVRTIPPQR